MAHQFLERFCKEYGKQLALSPRFVAFLEQYPWPGNVRQLENLMERLVITAQNPILDITALPLEYNSGGSAPDLPSQEGTLAERWMPSRDRSSGIPTAAAAPRWLWRRNWASLRPPLSGKSANM